VAVHLQDSNRDAGRQQMTENLLWARLLCISCTAAFCQRKEIELHTIKSVEDAKALEGQEVGISDWITIDQARINKFAEATDDFQWIHVDHERAARELPNGVTIAHGYLTLAMIPTLTGGFVHVENLARALNFGCNKVRFYTMVPVGSRVRGRATILQARKRGGALHLTSEVKIEVEGERKPACVAETLAMYFFNE
jgi:acyl dehydratase